MPLLIHGMATAVPQCSATQSTYAEVAERLHGHPPERQRVVSRLYRRSGVDRRGSVLMSESPENGSMLGFYGTPNDAADRGPTTAERMQRFERDALPLASEASAAALRDAGIPAERITHLVTASCTGFSAPGTDIQLVAALGLPAGVQRTHVGFMGCHGAFNAMRVACGHAAADSAALVLVCAYELCSLHYSYGGDPEQIVANALFADGAAASVCGHESSPRFGEVAGNETPVAWRLRQQASAIVPDTEFAMTWRITDHGFVMSLSPRVPQLIRQHLRPWLEQWLSSLGLTIPDIQSWAIHPGGPRIVDAAGEALGLHGSQLADSRAILAEHGNMSSPTIMFILNRIRRSAARLPCVAIGFGPGLTIEAMLFE